VDIRGKEAAAAALGFLVYSFALVFSSAAAVLLLVQVAAVVLVPLALLVVLAARPPPSCTSAGVLVAMVLFAGRAQMTAAIDHDVSGVVLNCSISLRLAWHLKEMRLSPVTVDAAMRAASAPSGDGL
jgi:hypothetical protein